MHDHLIEQEDVIQPNYDYVETEQFIVRQNSSRRQQPTGVQRRQAPRRRFRSYESDREREFADIESDSVGSSDNSLISHDDPRQAVDSVGGFYAVAEDPEVPEVDGLNAMSASGYGDLSDEDVDEDGVQYRGFVDFGPGDEDEEEEEEEMDVDLFTPKEVACLLLCHQVAQASRRNSRVCSKYAEAVPAPLLSPEQAAVMHSLFEPEGIMEVISVIASFNLLQRWTVCYPYKPGALEAPVRRFVQSPIGHDLSMNAVGQRTVSKHSSLLRIQTGRPLRLPRHAVVPLFDAE